MTAIELGTWRAIALGADGVAAAGLMLGVAGLLGVSITTLNKRQITWQALLLSAVLVVPLGLIGANLFADQPVDVTSQLRLHPLAYPSGHTASNQYTATLGVPKSLNVLDLRLALIDAYPGAGSCAGSSYQVQRMGAMRATRPAGSDAVTSVSVPAGVRQLELLVTVTPASACAITVYPESAVFAHH